MPPPNEFWRPQPIWRGATVYVVGGGPSLAGFDFEQLKGRRVLAVNAAGYDVPWADLLFCKSMDWPGCEELIESWQGIVASVSPGELPSKVKRLEARSRRMPRARTSGQYAVSLALLMGPARLVLLGFDWNARGGNYHARYARSGIAYRDVPASQWEGYRERGRRAGCEIVNATPRSAITEFPLVSLSEAL